MRCFAFAFLFAVICASVQAVVPGVEVTYTLPSSELGTVSKQIFSDPTGNGVTLFQIGSTMYSSNGTNAGLVYAFNLTNGQQVLGRYQNNLYVWVNGNLGPVIYAIVLQAPYTTVLNVTNNEDFTDNWVMFQNWLIFRDDNGVEALDLTTAKTTLLKGGDYWTGLVFTPTPIGVLFNYAQFIYLIRLDGTMVQIFNQTGSQVTVSVLSSSSNAIYVKFSTDAQSVYSTSGSWATKVAGVTSSMGLQATPKGLLSFVANSTGVVIQFTDLNNNVAVLTTITEHSYTFVQAFYANDTGLVWFIVDWTDSSLTSQNIVSANEVYVTDGTTSGTSHVGTLNVLSGGAGNQVLASGNGLAYFAGYLSSTTFYIFAMDKSGNQGSDGSIDGHGTASYYTFSDNRFYCWLDNSLVDISGSASATAAPGGGKTNSATSVVASFVLCVICLVLAAL